MLNLNLYIWIHQIFSLNTQAQIAKTSQRSVYLKRFLVTFSPNLHFPVCGFQQLNLKDEIARQIVHVKLCFEEYACNKPPPASWAHASFTI